MGIARSKKENSQKAEHRRNGVERTITVLGMNCGGCEESVESALEELDGVSAVSADNEHDSVTVDGGADTESIVSTIEDAGFEASV